MEAYGIQVRLLSDYGYMGSLTGSVDFSVTEQPIWCRARKASMCEMYPSRGPGPEPPGTGQYVIGMRQ